MGMFDEDAEAAGHCAEMMKAIAHPLRLRIASLLCEGDSNVSALAEKLGVAQSFASQQLRILRMAGLVQASRDNAFVNYRLAEPRLKQLIRSLEVCALAR